MHAKWLQSCPPLCHLVNCSLLGFSVYGILQAGILEWVVMPFSRGSSWPIVEPTSRTSTCIGRWVPYHQCHLGRPISLDSVSNKALEHARDVRGSIPLLSFFFTLKKNKNIKNKCLKTLIIPQMTRQIYFYSVKLFTPTTVTPHELSD